MARRRVLRTQPVREMRIMIKGGILLEASIPENLVTNMTMIIIVIS